MKRIYCNDDWQLTTVFSEALLRPDCDASSLETVRLPHTCAETPLNYFDEHIGDKAWKTQALENVREMVLQYRNHPSIILWGVRINESRNDNEFYTRTNAISHALNPTSPTKGVRCSKKSSLLEDVYAYNDFVHEEDNPGCEPKAKVTSDQNGNVLPYFFSPISLMAEGTVALIGPSLISLQGGMGGIYVKSLGRPGQRTLTLQCSQAAPVTIAFEVLCPQIF